MHKTITQLEISAVDGTIGFHEDVHGNLIKNETPEAWYNRNVSLVGEDEAVKRFKAKANRALKTQQAASS